MQQPYKSAISPVCQGRNKKPLQLFHRKLVFACFLLEGIFILCMVSCARIGSPTGGPRDEWPPKVLETLPENRSTSTETGDIEITFDEFIVLKNLNEELTISPPLKEKPISRVRNKTLVIDLNTELKDSITYTLNFGNAITDNNEGNPLSDYEFVFSTGPVIDSLSLTGKVVNAFTLKPEKEKILVMLYDNLSDSAPYKNLPLYIAKTSPEGKFVISNARSGNYRLFALKDGNNNLRFDNPDEMIGFSDTTIRLSPEMVQKVSFVKDTSMHIAKAAPPAKSKHLKTDTIRHDSIKWIARELYARNVDLFVFTEEEMKQRIIEKERERREMIKIGFSRPLFDSLLIVPLNFSSAGNWCMKDFSAMRDTVKIWITDPQIWKKDTVSLALTYTATDSAMNLYSRTDTVLLRYRAKDIKGGMSSRGKRKETATDSTFLAVSFNFSKQTGMNLNSPLILISPSPLDSFDIRKIRLERGEDTVFVQQDLYPEKDTLSSSLYSVRFTTRWEEDKTYQLQLEPGALTDIYGKTNDTILISFRTQKVDFYGRILLTLDSPVFPVIVQLLDEKEGLIMENYVKEGGPLVMDYLPPKKYRVRAIFDRNENKKWDTGNFLRHLQPEEVMYYPDLLELRSNWDIDISWKINE